MSKDSPLAQKKYIEKQDLIGIPIINTKRAIVQNEIENWLGVDFEKLDIVATYNLIYNVAILVEKGFGYAICLEKLVNINDETKTSFKPFYPKLQTGCVIAWKKHQVFSKSTTKFIEYVKDAFKA
ncbi:hypothetical protein D3C73_1057370 [compost metagenome]